ncbi:MAG: hypothetical protein IPL79_14165 [Myxococcales bacterium]|nr:hypothetical protein [Myxococcales bacterium]
MANSRGGWRGALMVLSMALHACATADTTLGPQPDGPPPVDAAPDSPGEDGPADATPDSSPDSSPDGSPDAAPDAGPGDACATAQNITAAASQAGGTTINGTTTGGVDNVLTPSTCTGYGTDGPDDVYAITVIAGDVVSITMDPTTSWDASVQLVAACGEVSCLAGTDGGLSGITELVQHTFTAAGTFYVVADSWDSGVSGPYALTVIITHP